MKTTKRAISNLYAILITAVVLVVLSSSVYSFSVGGGIYAKCDTKSSGTVPSKEKVY